MNAEKVLATITQNPAELEIKDVVHHGPCDEYRVVFPDIPLRICPQCGSNDCVKKGGRIQRVRHVPVAKKNTFLSFHRRYYLCKRCHVSFPEPVYWLYPDARITMALYLSICEDLQTVMSVTDIALNNGVSESVVRHVMTAVKFDRPPLLPETISIDEFGGHSGIWKQDKKRWEKNQYHCLIANGDMGCVFDILPAAGSALLIEYFKQYSAYERSKVKYFTCDFRSGFRLVGKTCFPNASICLDMFHIVRLQTDSIKDIYNAILRRARAEENEEKVRLLFHAHRLLTAWKHKPSGYWSSGIKKKQERLDAILALSDELKEAYYALQEFYTIVHSDQYGWQRIAFSEWIHEHSLSHYDDMKRIANTYRKNKEFILNSFKYNKSNAVCEGLNNRIKLIKKNGYGAHKFDNFRRRILFACGHTKLVKDTYTLFGLNRASGKEGKQCVVSSTILQ